MPIYLILLKLFLHVSTVFAKQNPELPPWILFLFIGDDLPHSAIGGPSADLLDRCHEPAVTRLDDADPARSVVFVSEDEGGIPAAVEVQRDRDRVLRHRFEDVSPDRQALSVPIVRVDNSLCSHEHGVVILILAGKDLLDCT